MARLQRYAPSLVVLCTALIILLAGPEIVQRLGFAYTVAKVRRARLQLETSTVLEQINDAYRNIAQAVEPSVVTITVRRQTGQREERSSGSGWVYDTAGHIITNYHVVADATLIEVRFNDGTTQRAELVGSDVATDIAVIRTNSRLIVPAVRAAARSVSQGDMVFAFGSPFGFEFSMSAGIVSGQGRRAGLSGYENFIQTDAAVNPGNSGGPLTDVDGRIVGMNIAIAVDPSDPVRSGRFTGAALAIPIEMIEFVVDQLIDGGQVRRGGLGIEFAELDRRLRDGLGYNGPGILINQVSPGYPADLGGLEVGDVLIALDGQPVLGGAVFRSRLHTKAPGTHVTLRLWRDANEFETLVVLGTWEANGRGGAVAGPQTPIVSRNFDALGFTAAEVTKPLARQLGLRTNSGLYVQRVRIGSPGWDAGIRPGWILITAARTTIENLDDLEAALREALVGSVPLELTLLDDAGERSTVRLRP